MKVVNAGSEADPRSDAEPVPVWSVACTWDGCDRPYRYIGAPKAAAVEDATWHRQRHQREERASHDTGESGSGA